MDKKKFVYESGKGTRKVLDTHDPLVIHGSGVGLSKAEFDQACVDVVVDGVTRGMQELVRRVMKREFVRDPEPPDEWCPEGRFAYLDGRFQPDELEAMAWCMRNDKWPAR